MCLCRKFADNQIPRKKYFTRNHPPGLLAALFFWVALGMTIMPDGPFLRPHPALWRFAFAVSIVYELLLIFVLFQSPNDAR
jgi:phosphatidylserine synthase 2